MVSVRCFARLFALAMAMGAAIAAAPPMGWNSWYALGKAAGWPITNQSTVRATADAMKRTGLVESGYRYLVVDDSWENDHREPDGRLLANPTKFPDGMKATVEYAQQRGLELGLYTTPGMYTCAGAGGGGEPGSLGHIAQDVQLWVDDWGVRYLKDCVCNTTHALRQHAYKDMADALNRSGHQVMYECDPFMEKPWITMQGVCDLWAVSDDIADSFQAWTHQLDASYAAGVIPDGGPGGWNSFDYLQVGNGGQSYTEYRSQLSMYSMIPAPLFVGTDVRNISPETLQIYQAAEVVGVNQDTLGMPGTRLWQLNQTEVWVRPLQRAVGSRAVCAVALFNRGAEPKMIRVEWSELGPVLGRGWRGMTLGLVRDLWREETVGVLEGGVEFNVGPHELKLLRVSAMKA